MAQCKIAIQAKNSISKRIVLFLKPYIKGLAAVPFVDFSAMRCAIAIHVVNSQEFNMALTTTYTKASSVNLKSLHFMSKPVRLSFGFYPLLILTISFTLICLQSLFMKGVISMGVFQVSLFIRMIMSTTSSTTAFFMGLSPGSLPSTYLFRGFVFQKNTASLQRTALTQHAGERQLISIIPQKGYV